MKFSEHKFDRVDEIFAQKPISQLIVTWGPQTIMSMNINNV